MLPAAAWRTHCHVKVCVFNETTVLLVTDSSGVVCLALEGWEPLS